MAVKRVVSTDFWTDNKVVDMFSPEDKLFMLYLLTNPHASLLGIYPFSIKVAAFEIGFSPEAVKVLLERFINKYNIVCYSEKTQEIAVLNWLKHSVMKGGKPVMDCLETDIKKVKEKDLIAKVFDCIKHEEVLIPTVREFVDKYSSQFNINNIKNNNFNINKNINMDMDMDMELRGRNVVRNVDVTLKPPKKNPKHKYGQYQNVLLTDEEMEKLHNEFPFDWQERIERLSEYVASTGKSYKNHLATIRSWAKKETKVSYPKAKGNIEDLNDVAIEVEAILEREGW